MLDEARLAPQNSAKFEKRFGANLTSLNGF